MFKCKNKCTECLFLFANVYLRKTVILNNLKYFVRQIPWFPSKIIVAKGSNFRKYLPSGCVILLIISLLFESCDSQGFLESKTKYQSVLLKCSVQKKNAFVQ